jgi:hypothetical protein
LMIPIAQHDWTKINIIDGVQNWPVDDHGSDCPAGILGAVMGFRTLNLADIMQGQLTVVPASAIEICAEPVRETLPRCDGAL